MNDISKKILIKKSNFAFGYFSKICYFLNDFFFLPSMTSLQDFFLATIAFKVLYKNLKFNMACFYVLGNSFLDLLIFPILNITLGFIQ